ncbi:MAG: DUF362 domain-containing protein [Bacilli bacterium]
MCLKIFKYSIKIKEGYKMPALVNQNDCIGCSACVGSCPVSVIEMTDEGKALVTDGCIECGACIGVCPVSCIEMV